MSDKKDRVRQTLDVASSLVAVTSTVVDVGGTGGALSGGKLLWTAVTGGVARRRRRQAEAYLERLAEALGNEDTIALAVELDAAGENEIWETVEEGFRAMMGAINETAKKCIAQLVADYVVRQELPDREFQLMGALLAASDEKILRTLFAVTRQVLELDSQGVVEDSSSYTLYLKRELLGPVAMFVARQWRIEDLVPSSVESQGEVCPDNLQIVARLLSDHSFGEGSLVQSGAMMWHNDDGSLPHGASPILGFQEATAVRFRRLHGYLKAVFFETSTR